MVAGCPPCRVGVDEKGSSGATLEPTTRAERFFRRMEVSDGPSRALVERNAKASRIVDPCSAVGYRGIGPTGIGIAAPSLFGKESRERPNGFGSVRFEEFVLEDRQRAAIALRELHERGEAVAHPCNVDLAAAVSADALEDGNPRIGPKTREETAP